MKLNLSLEGKIDPKVLMTKSKAVSDIIYPTGFSSIDSQLGGGIRAGSLVAVYGHKKEQFINKIFAATTSGQDLPRFIHLPALFPGLLAMEKSFGKQTILSYHKNPYIAKIPWNAVDSVIDTYTKKSIIVIAVDEPAPISFDFRFDLVPWHDDYVVTFRAYKNSIVQHFNPVLVRSLQGRLEQV